MEFKQGEFRKFQAKTMVHLGALRDREGNLGVTVPAGHEIEFDGTTVRYGSFEGDSPAVRGAIKSDWLVLVGTQGVAYRPQPAGVRVRPATSTGDTRGEEMQMQEAAEDEQVVGSLGETNKKRADSVAERVAAAQAAAPSVAAAPKAEAAPVTVQSAEKPPAEVQYPGVEKKFLTVSEDQVSVGPAVKSAEAMVGGEASSEGEVVATFKTPTDHGKVEVTSLSQASSEIAKIESATLAVEKTFKSATVVSDQDGVDIRATHESGATGDVSETIAGDDLTDLLPDAAQGAAPFTWVMDGKHWRTRVKDAMGYVDKPAVMRQILSVESPSVQSHIKSSMARAGKHLPE